MAHVTGGGIAANLARVVPDSASAVVDRSTWRPAPVFDVVREVGQIDRLELERTLNMGVGMLAVLDADDADRAVALLADHGVEAWTCGVVVDRAGDPPPGSAGQPTAAYLVGTHT
jgi:phosphoribosylformylglycinamidine cyclo-ligase